MSAKTKIIVLHRKEVLYTAIFAVFAIVILFVLFFMFSPDNKKEKSIPTAVYTAGVYSSSISLGGQTVDVEVTVDEDHINSISFRQLDESIAAMYPLMQPALQELTAQICEKQSLDNIHYSADSQYTSQVLLHAIQNALDKAASSSEPNR